MPSYGTDELVKQLEEQHKVQRDLVNAKNRDYAESGNPFENFATTAAAAGVGIEQAFLFHLVNKMTRAKNLLAKDADVSSEPLEDTLHDMANYANLWLAYRAHFNAF